jgi:choline kinase
MCAEDLMSEPFLCCYSDILFTPSIIEKLKNSKSDMRLGVDTEWLVRYGQRTDHPPDDAEKVIVSDGRVVRVHREMPEEAAYGEYIGVAGFSQAGAEQLRRAYHRVQQEFAGRPWREAKIFEKAYLILLFQEMIEAGEQFAHVDTPGGYIEVDTQQDFEYARQHWLTRHRER